MLGARCRQSSLLEDIGRDVIGGLIIVADAEELVVDGLAELGGQVLDGGLWGKKTRAV